MATRRAVADGNWSATSTWAGGTSIPGNGDTVYSNGRNVTLDVDVNIGGANNPIVNTGSLVSGQWYEIVNPGGQNWANVNAGSSAVGTIFQSSGTGTAGNFGTARALATLTTATNTAAGATTGGGVFTMSTVRAMTADLRAGTTTCLNVTATTGTLTLSGLRAIGGSVAGAHGVNTTANTDLASCTVTCGGSGGGSGLNNAGIGTINISAPCTFAGGFNASSAGLNNASTGTVNISAPCTFTGGSAGGNAQAFNNAQGGTVNILASCTFTGSSTFGGNNAFNNAGIGTINISAPCTFAAGNNAHALNNAGIGPVNISAPCTFTGGGTGVSGLNNNSTGTVIIINGTFIASSSAAAITSTSSADVRLSGNFLDHWSGWKAVNCAKWRLGTPPTLGQTRYALLGTTDSYYTMYGADNGAFGNPIAADVRSGISYGGGNITGTCAVPTAGSVALGVPVDATTGTAILTQANVQSALTEQGITTARAGNLDNLDTTVSSRLAPSGTLATVTTLTNAPTVPSASAIASQVRTELATELARVDQNISSRLAAADYNAPTSAPTAASVANAVWSAATKEITGGTVTTLTNAPSVPTPAQIASQVRTELATELARVDVATSTRLASSAYTAPANSDIAAIKSKTDNLPASPAATGDIPSANITAIKAKTDLLNTDRLAQVSTVSTTGAQLAAALS